ncbi:hypothetical protein CVU83_02215 [Candidatus Falkowbacteria bacterium HGW-Falkowbacteria-2]|uniref:Uncharacterized protein n=1 Tax=Candidatus Falkowbacteria bacterium HGW-Falkowbacteria-2 TaxID=2013769 RepID=A0A2N2E051_9BACT|nr:MAG: hypothetical protein CVU83_02215 [Candidatus Falkowbacteria bacterium HGW-Falkowbacteria-2]
MANFKQRTRRIWLTLIALIIVFFAFQIISPSGHWTCRQDFSVRGENLFNRTCLGQASPGERVARGAGGPLLLLADPVYLSVFAPRAFSQAEVTIVYRPHLSSSTPIFEAGFLADSKLWRYRLQPIYNLWLEKGLSDWNVIKEDTQLLFQKENRFTSISEFLNEWQTGESVCQSVNCIGTYNVDLQDYPPVLNLSTLTQADSNTVLPYTLRGAHQFYLYLSGNDLEVSGRLLDRNNNIEKDDAEFLIFSGQRAMASVKIEDDRSETEMSGEDSAPESFRISRNDLQPGLYRLEFRANDDLSLENLTVNSAYLSAINKIWPDGADPVRLYSDAPYLQAKAIDPAVLQDIRFGESIMELSEIYKQHEVKSNRAGIQTIELASGGVLLENNGVFAAQAEQLLNPEYPRLDRFAPLSGQLDYVFADYQPAEQLEDGWLKSSVIFASGDFYREKSNYNLILSAPGMRLDSGAGGLIEIKEISVKFSGKNLWDKIRELMLNL